MAAVNQYYDNFMLENEINYMYKTKLAMSQFCTPDTSLVGVAGDKVQVNVYTASEGAEEVALGEGNTKEVTVSLSSKEYEVKTVQTRFAWFDEEARRDPLVPIVGGQRVVADLVNKMNEDILAAMATTTTTVTATSDYFADIIDALAALTLDDKADFADESLNPGANCFAIMHKKDVAKLRKSAKDSLQYVEAFVTTGYIGTVAGVNVYVSDACTEGTYFVGHKSALKLITKTAVEVEPDRDPNLRKNWLYERQAYIPVLYDPTKLCKVSA